MTSATLPASHTDADSAAAAPAQDALTALAETLLARAQELAAAEKRPLATYRVQFHAGFTFREATALVPYWHALGITHVYASPYLKSGSQSTHGYDVVDHAQLDPRIGAEDDFARFVATLREHGLGHMLDIVPNHMGVGNDENAWWQDVLEHGPASAYATFFDIDWHPLKPDLENKVLLPVLGEQFGLALEEQKLVLHFDAGVFFLTYGARRFPIAPRTYAQILRLRLEELTPRLAAEAPENLEYHSILTAIGYLPDLRDTEAAKLAEGQREQEVIKRRLKQLCENSPPAREFIDENVRLYNGQRGDAASFDRLDELLREQSYRLCYWQVAADEINYRRFFDVNELAAVCTELPHVFERTHQHVLERVRDGSIQGLRVDHADGLYDPAGYLWQLQRQRWLQLARVAYDERPPSDGAATAPAWDDVARSFEQFLEARRQVLRPHPPLYVVVEKILEANEALPDDWSVHGTTGYEFLGEVSGLFVHPRGLRPLEAAYARFTGEKTRFDLLAYDTKRLIMKVSLAGELHMLGHRLDRLSECTRQARDFTLPGLTLALREVLACFPVYRTYVTPHEIHERDAKYIKSAVAAARRRNPALAPAVFDFVEDVLLGRAFADAAPSVRQQAWQFVGRVQQFTGALMAKAVEDTAYYRYFRLVSLNEVGGDPRSFGVTPVDFHLFNRSRRAKRPYTLSATATHDTKRGEDMRVRINVISECPRRWKEQARQWARLNRRHKEKLDGEVAPSANDEYLIYQTLLGSWPFETPHGEALTAYRARLEQYFTKAVREAKVHSSWIAPNLSYERALHAFVAKILDDSPRSEFRAAFEPFVAEISRTGIWNSLSQSVLKICSPGVPDVYQGSELWDFSLVDPDNRRPVDFALRQELLAAQQTRLAADAEEGVMGYHEAGLGDYARELMARPADGHIKFFVLSLALNLRREHPDLFTRGDYVPLEIKGPRAEHVVAFARQHGETAALVVAPRLMGTLHADGRPPLGRETWAETELVLPPSLREREFRNLYVGRRFSPRESLPLAEVLEEFPVAVLVSRL